MFYEFKIKDSFYEQYLSFYLDRFIYTAIDVEDDKDQVVSKSKKNNLLKAFKYALSVDDDCLNVYDIKDLGDLINKDEDVPEGFRRIRVSAGNKATFTPVRPNEIIVSLYCLLDNYKNLWCDLDPYEREARFHIEFMRIHPFEDGNKRTAKTILNRNLLFQDKAPVIIDYEETDLYYQFINNRDYDGFAKFLEQKSKNELTNMVGLYKLLNNVPVDVEGNSLTKKK